MSAESLIRQRVVTTMRSAALVFIRVLRMSGNIVTMLNLTAASDGEFMPIAIKASMASDVAVPLEPALMPSALGSNADMLEIQSRIAPQNAGSCTLPLT